MPFREHGRVGHAIIALPGERQATPASAPGQASLSLWDHGRLPIMVRPCTGRFRLVAVTAARPTHRHRQ